MSKNLQERTTETEVFQDMDNFDLLNDSSTFALSLRLQFPKFAKGFTSSDFEPFVRLHVGEENLVSLGRLSFPNEWQMQVKCKEVRENLIRMGKTKINTRTCWISPLSQSEVRGFIHWIPTAVHNRKLEVILRAYGEVLFLENQKQKKWTLPNVQSDSRYFALYLKSGKTMDDVPHFIRVNDYYGLITIRGRNPACFHCKELGHRKTECKFYREKISDYSMRPAGSARPRFKPRGKRHNQGKKSAAKSVNQEVQTDEVELDDAEFVSGAAVEASAAAIGGPVAEAAAVEVPAAEAVKQEVPAASGGTKKVAGKQVVSSSERTQPAARQSPNSKAKGQKKKQRAVLVAQRLEALFDNCEAESAKNGESIPEGNIAATDGNKDKDAKGAQAAARLPSSKPKKTKALSLEQIEDDLKPLPPSDFEEFFRENATAIEGLDALLKDEFNSDETELASAAEAAAVEVPAAEAVEQKVPAAKGAQSSGRLPSSKPKGDKVCRSFEEVQDRLKELVLSSTDRNEDEEALPPKEGNVKASDSSKDKVLPPKEASSTTDGNKDEEVLPAKEANVSTTVGNDEKEALPAKEGNVDENNFGVILEQAMDSLSLTDGKSAEGKKKRKKRKKKKNVEVGTCTVPSDFL